MRAIRTRRLKLHQLHYVQVSLASHSGAVGGRPSLAVLQDQLGQAKGRGCGFWRTGAVVTVSHSYGTASWEGEPPGTGAFSHRVHRTPVPSRWKQGTRAVRTREELNVINLQLVKMDKGLPLWDCDTLRNSIPLGFALYVAIRQFGARILLKKCLKKCF